MFVCNIDGPEEDCCLCVMEDPSFCETDCDVAIELSMTDKPHSECPYYVNYDPPTAEEMRNYILDSIKSMEYDNPILIDTYMELKNSIGD